MTGAVSYTHLDVYKRQVWKYLIRPFGGIWDIYELLPVFCVSIIVNIIVSHLTYTPDPDVENDFCHYMETVKKV